MNKHNVKSIFATLKHNNPKPTTELHYNNNLQLLIAVILSAQTTDIMVNKATDKLFDELKTAQDFHDFGEENLIKHIKIIGLFRNKAKNVIKTCKILHEEYNGEIPNSRSELEKLPGVGRKTANVVLNTAFGVDVIAIDTHIYRLAHRIGLSNGKTPLEVEKDLYKVIPTTYLKDAHHWLILHGRYICRARSPKCNSCCIFSYCNWNEKTKYLET